MTTHFLLSQVQQSIVEVRSEFLVKAFTSIASLTAIAAIFIRCIPALHHSFRLVKDTLYRKNSCADWPTWPGEEIERPKYDGHWLWRNVFPALFVLESVLRAILLRSGKTIFFITQVRLEAEFLQKNKEGVEIQKPWGESASAGFDQIITFKNISDLLDDKCGRYVSSYFRALQKFDRSRDSEKEIESISTIRIRSGFVAPMFLLTGLLPQMEADWKVVGESYSKWREIAKMAYPGLNELISLQSFLFDCWLLWGPSISLPDLSREDVCENWEAHKIPAQYGFGDENNSICLIYERRDPFLKEWLARAQNSEGAGSALQYPFALPASMAEGKLWFIDDRFVWENDTRTLKSKTTSKFGNATAAAGHPGWDRTFGLKGTVTPMPSQSGHYYSAYLWTLFLTLDSEGRLLISTETLKPQLFEQLRSTHSLGTLGPWRNLLTFFEHGNIADADSYTFLERHLAIKTAHSLWKLASNQTLKPLPYFVYGGALDDLNCKKCHSLEPHRHQLGYKVAQELNKICKEEAGGKNDTEREKAAKETRSRIVMPGDPWHPRHPNFAHLSPETDSEISPEWKRNAEGHLKKVRGCNLFEVIADYYQWLEMGKKNDTNSPDHGHH